MRAAMSPTLLLCFALALPAFGERVKPSSLGHVEINNLRLPSSKLPSTIKEHNISIYIDKTENILRVPDLKKNYEEHKTKRKNFKKSPKRTVQKIIKKNRSRRKMYLNQATVMPTKAPTADELEQFYAQEEMQQRNENYTGTQDKNTKKKRKWNVARYPMPFQHMGPKGYKRNKREDREDVFIFTDLNEMEFLKDSKDENVINAHIKKYW